MKKSGFTLIELLIVIAIIGILAAVLVPNLLNARRVAADRAGEAQAQNIYKAAFAYLAENPSANSVPTCGTGGAYSAGSYTVNAANLQGFSCSVSFANGNLSVGANWSGGVRGSVTVGQ